MAKTLRYPNGMVLKGVHSRVALLRGVKRNTTGTVSMVAAPTATVATTALGAVKSTSAVLSCGLTGASGARGRNFVGGKFYVKGTNAGKNGIYAYLKTIGGAKVTLGTGTAAATKTKTITVATNTKGLPWGAPGKITLKGTCVPTTKKVDTLKFMTLKVNDMTTMMM